MKRHEPRLFYPGCHWGGVSSSSPAFLVYTYNSPSNGKYVLIEVIMIMFISCYITSFCLVCMLHNYVVYAFIYWINFSVLQYIIGAVLYWFTICESHLAHWSVHVCHLILSNVLNTCFYVQTGCICFFLWFLVGSVSVFEVSCVVEVCCPGLCFTVLNKLLISRRVQWTTLYTMS